MNSKWRQLDLGGGGLQAANLRLARTLRRRATAWLLLLLFPAGAHCWYLHERRIAPAYPALSLIAAAGWAGAVPWVAPAALAGLVLLLLRDVVTLEDRIVACNKRLRMATYLSQGATAPPGFRGRYPAIGSAEGTASGQRNPTFAEQEALLHEISARKGGKGEKPG